MSFSLYMCFMYNLLVFVHVSCSHIPYVICSSCTFAFFQQLQLNYTHTVYTNLLFIIVLYFVHIIYYTHVISCHEIFCVI